ncbi:sigma 54-interacting transcriptional regulator [Abyssisolibacter fermentans]|uniref:sigma 54-interacting transcriptional regulator n=1 Tax=Abyssisolibacter fermentans TaxID=1766203 RepID=UPI00082AFF2D|nr:sigma 54-interacting transcriptional regulator [Abyssisolibacter fermentans]
MQNIISVTQNKCKQCYACVRNCPVKAVQIKNGQAEILYSRCINCGSCINSCPQNAKIVLDSETKCLDILKNNKKVIACLAPSFVVSFHTFSYKRVIRALKKLGFDEVWETAFGAEEVSNRIKHYIDENDKKTYISTACTAFTTMIEKHYPELIKYLLPFVSPMISVGKIIRKKYPDTDTKVVFIGPCVAKKAEAMEFQYEGIIDCVLTFEEIKRLFIKQKINIRETTESELDVTANKNGRLFPLSGGMIKNVFANSNSIDNQYIYIDEAKDCFELIDSLLNKKFTFKFIDVLMCKGCINGCKIDSDLSMFEKIHTIKKFYNEREPVNNSKYIDTDVDYNRTFTNRRNILPYPSEEEIKKVLIMTDKYSQEDELNCGACGYNTCREKAIAVLQGIAEVEMCLPYLISKKTKLLRELSTKLNEITTLKEELETIIESSYDGMMVTDGEGKILKINKAWKRIIGFNENKDNVLDMENNNIIFPSGTLLVLKEKRRLSFIQNTLNARQHLATATPIFDENGVITRVVTNIRDIEELNKLRDQLYETKKLQKYFSNGKDRQESNLDIVGNNNLVANSIEFGRILQTASKVACVDSTILVLGESGVGKEVIAKFIHGLSNRKNKSMVKINCGAIPESLIESELFGYETGAFTGASKRGKPGLIEVADEGTLFLDEIGDLPLNIQVKLLRVIQEKTLTRIGGTKEININVRIIAATNKDLFKMVQESTFRSDLYYRLNVVPINIPPLRDRIDDILPLCYHFLNIYNNKYSCNKNFTSHAEDALKNYCWPGNVRELENLIERLVVTARSDVIDRDDLPAFLFANSSCEYSKIEVNGIVPLKEATEQVEKMLIEKAYKKYRTTYEIAQALKVNQSTIVRKIQKYFKHNAFMHD